MDDFCQTWVRQASATSGCLLCGVRRTDHSVAAASRDKTFPETHAGQLMQLLAETFHLLQQNQIAAGRLSWTFEYGRIYCAIHPNGGMAMLLVDEKSVNPAAVDKLLLNFQQAGF